ncbi:hypothetical protein PGTUg99_000402 [Puccinia graminis f. sp. tritici]|uniref:Uncharacterized protein n=1 Tax=Puccinia graminis f. sp. tritici TaxID=56615 RepID=A0A5B0QYA4_PUCGR|nr:hypothetical protein PGTUg99_000402 [Puccinia graminis f. sp. tritici]
MLADIWESGVVNEKAIFLLCGEADFKIPAESVIIDRKIKASMNPKTLLTLKILRQRFQQLFNLKMKNPSQKFNQQQQRWFDLMTAAIQDDKDAIKINKNEISINRTNAPTNAISIKPKNRMSVVLAPAGRIPSISNSNNISPLPQESIRHSDSKDNQSVVDPGEDIRTTFYETTGRLSELSISSPAPSNAGFTTSNLSTPTPAAAGSVYDHPPHVHYNHHQLENFDHTK